jgi:hypothetical protein
MLDPTKKCLKTAVISVSAVGAVSHTKIKKSLDSTSSNARNEKKLETKKARNEKS